MDRIAYYNGEIDAPERLKVPFLDRCTFFGDGVYDALMARDGIMVYLEEHLDRFWDSMEIMRIRPDFTREFLLGELKRTLDMAASRDNFVYWQVTRGTALRRHAFPDTKPNLWIMVVPESFSDLSKTMDLVTFEDKRYEYCHVKSINLLPNVLASQYAADAGADECLFVRNGFVTECAHSNIHILHEGTLITHPADEHILPGVARKHLIEACKRLGISVSIRAFRISEAFAADEVILSASSTFAARIARIDGIEVGRRDSETLERLQEELERECEDYLGARADKRASSSSRLSGK